MPLVYPATYSDLSCLVEGQSKANGTARRLQEGGEVTVRIKDIDVLVNVTSSVVLPETQSFQDIVNRTFDTFGTEFRSDLSASSGFFQETGAAGTAVTPVVKDTAPTTKAGKKKLPWAVIGGAIAGGVCLALAVSFLVLRNRGGNAPAEEVPSNQRSKSISCSSFRDMTLMKIVSVKPSKNRAPPPVKEKRSLEEKVIRSLEDASDDGVVMVAPTPIRIPEMVDGSPADIESELSPSSYLGECGCLEQTDTFDATIGDANSPKNFASMYGSSLADAYERNCNEPSDGARPMTLSADSSELHGLSLVDTLTAATESMDQQTTTTGPLAMLGFAKKKTRVPSLRDQANHKEVNSVIYRYEAQKPTDEVFDDQLDHGLESRTTLTTTPKQANTTSQRSFGYAPSP